ncbi:helix-turn-helix domain-containing protein [Edaphobacter sp. HDX4]|uniref:helix-turn-helix transcriptional regulator n=1 Tax=Edaphobacter sp. HDX4 TaxID=2794064 RepID=UPI002FE5078B
MPLAVVAHQTLETDPLLTPTDAAKSEVSTRPGDDSRPPTAHIASFPVQERLLNAREVAARLGVSERWVRDHTTRRFPKLRGVKLGTLVRYRSADVQEFTEKLTTSRSSLQPRFGG